MLTFSETVLTATIWSLTGAGLFFSLRARRKRSLQAGRLHLHRQAPILEEIANPATPGAPQNKGEMMMEATTRFMDKTIGEIVAEDYRTAKVFDKYGIDFCCGGQLALAAACSEQGVDPEMLSRELEAAKREPAERRENYAEWELSFLADYIVNTHHAYIKKETGQIAAYAQKIAEVHGPRHPELGQIAGIFDKVADDLTAHLREEEENLFPAVKRLEAAAKSGAAPAPGDVETIRGCLQKLNQEHEEVGEAVHTIRRLSQGYALPADACNTYLVTYQKLREFEDDLHKHVHLENNILFPKAGQL